MRVQYYGRLASVHMGLSLRETIFFSCFLLPRTQVAFVQVELNMGGRRVFAGDCSYMPWMGVLSLAPIIYGGGGCKRRLVLWKVREWATSDNIVGFFLYEGE